MDKGEFPVKEGFYIQLFSIHGLLRHENMELGRDADTGGQIKYVVELAQALARHENVKQVDLFTRLIADKRVSEDYSRPVEKISETCRIVRIQCGGKKYMRKELLWPYLDEYIDKTIQFIRRQKQYPDIIHAHYPDGGYVGICLSEYFGTPFVYTGHSMGRVKKQRLLGEGMKEDDIEKKYFIRHRIAAEEEIIKHADLIVTSTHQEAEDQYGMYDNRELAAYTVIPPGVDLEKFYPYHRNLMPDQHRSEDSVMAYASVVEELMRFFKSPDKPLILALCRADKRKNIRGLIEAFGQDKELQAIANLAIFAGIRKNIADMEDNERDVLTEMLLLMDKYDLYGKMAIPKKHDFTYEVPELYRIAAEKKGVFVNAALTEPFGLTLIEASACGLPLVATNDGGPRDIIRNCENGLLTDPTDSAAISRAVKEILVDPEKWKQFSCNGIRGVHRHYDWDAHAQKYISEIKKFKKAGREPASKKALSDPVGERLTRLSTFLITDIDDTLLGDDASLTELMGILRENRDVLGFGVATGRTLESAVQLFKELDLMMPDLFITSVGAEIYYGRTCVADRGWQTHISKRWNREKIKNILDAYDFLSYQEEETQRACKISYYMAPAKDRVPMVCDVLIQNKCHCNVIYSNDKYLDILPARASKGRAVRYLSYKWDIPLENILVCGDSGNDEEMLTSSTCPGVVVSNYRPELEKLRGRRRIWFSSRSHAGGIIDGLRHYQLMEKAKSVTGRTA